MTPEADHRELRSLLGAYILGGLGSADRTKLENHLTGCRDCEQELARLAPVPGLLGRLREYPEPAPAEPPSADLLPRLLDASRRERRGLQRRVVLRTLAVASAVVVIVAVVVTGAKVVTGPNQPAATTVALQAAAGYDSVGSAALTAKPWGTAMTLELHEMPPAGPFRLEVTGPDGSSQVAGMWGATPTGVAVVSGATALAADEVRLVRVLGPAGTVLEGSLSKGD